MQDNLFVRYMRECENKYKQFMGISNFPNYELVGKELTLEKSEKQGFDSVATAFYDTSTGNHRLVIWSKLYMLQPSGKYIVYHELTHMLDAEKYVQKDKLKYLANHGYTEYHAAQIELLLLLGAKNIKQPISFSMKQVIDTIVGEKTVSEFVEAPLRHASELISREDFPSSIETLKTTLGLIFNYYGRRSICKMYSVDYLDNEDKSTIAKLIYKETVDFLNGFMTDFFNDTKVGFIDALYQKMIFYFISQYHLN